MKKRRIVTYICYDILTFFIIIKNLSICNILVHEKNSYLGKPQKLFWSSKKFLNKKLAPKLGGWGWGDGPGH